MICTKLWYFIFLPHLLNGVAARGETISPSLLSSWGSPLRQKDFKEIDGDKRTTRCLLQQIRRNLINRALNPSKSPEMSTQQTEEPTLFFNYPGESSYNNDNPYQVDNPYNFYDRPYTLEDIISLVEQPQQPIYTNDEEEKTILSNIDGAGTQKNTDDRALFQPEISYKESNTESPEGLFEYSTMRIPTVESTLLPQSTKTDTNDEPTNINFTEDDYNEEKNYPQLPKTELDISNSNEVNVPPKKVIDYIFVDGQYVRDDMLNSEDLEEKNPTANKIKKYHFIDGQHIIANENNKEKSIPNNEMEKPKTDENVGTQITANDSGNHKPQMVPCIRPLFVYNNRPIIPTYRIQWHDYNDPLTLIRVWYPQW